MGRPTDSPKSIVIRARISEEENRMLNDCIDKSGKTKTDVIVEGIRLVYEGLLRPNQATKTSPAGSAGDMKNEKG